MKKIRYFFEAAGLYLLFGFFRLLTPRAASNIGGWIGRTLGPKLAKSRTALRNLQAALPDLDEKQQHQTITEMWDNLGRIIAEYPHLKTIGLKQSTIKNREILEKYAKGDQPVVFISAHTANFEMASVTALTLMDIEIDLTYRAPNNPWIQNLLSKSRAIDGRLRAYPKGREGGKSIIKALKEGNKLGIMIDQKYNEGLAVPFFGRPVMTNPAFVQLAQKFKCPLIPVHMVRYNKTEFTLEIHEPIPVFDENGGVLPTEKVIQSAHALLEKWISDHPGQWIWLHKRWD